MSFADLVTASLNGTQLADAVPSAIIVAVARQLAGERRHVFVDVPGRSGSYLFPEQPGDRTLRLELDLQCSTFDERRAAVRDLAGWADLSDSARLILSDEPDRYHVAILDDRPELLEQLVYAASALVFRVGPYALAITPSTATLAVSGAGSDSGTFTGTETGGVDAFPVVEITPNDGTLTSFGWTLNGTQLSYGTTVAMGDTITISSLSDTVTLGASGDTDLTGAFVTGLVSMATVSGDFGRVVPGSNDWAFEWTGTATDITIDLTWRERYR